MKKALFVLGALLWLPLVFLLVFRLTFPSDALITRAQVAVDQASAGAFRLDMGSAAPSWIGVSGSDVVVSTVADDEATPLMGMEEVAVSATLRSLVARAPSVTGHARFGTGRLDFSGVVAPDEDGYYHLSEVDLDARALPLSAFPPIQGTKLVGTGALDVVLNADAWDGWAMADGRVALHGAGLTIDDLTGGMGSIAKGFGILPATIDGLDLEFDLVQGRAQVVRGVLDSSLALVQVEGDVQLRDNLMNSALRLDLIIEPRDGLSAVQSLMTPARWDDEKYHYSLRGHLSSPRFAPARQRRGRRGRGANTAGSEPGRRPSARREATAQRGVNTREAPKPQRRTDPNADARRQETLDRARTDRAALRRGRALRSPGAGGMPGAPRVLPLGNSDMLPAGDGEDTGAPPAE